MSKQTFLGRLVTGLIPVLVVTAICVPVQAQALDESFDGVSGAPGGEFFSGSGFSQSNDWDSGITGESAFAGTVGRTRFTSVVAEGLPTGGFNGTGGAWIDVVGMTFDLLNEDFEAATGTGGGQFLVGDGSTPDVEGYTPGWDDGLESEAAFAGTNNGATIAVGEGASAAGLTSGGVSGTSAGQITMSGVIRNSGTWYGGLMWTMGPFPQATPLYNSDFEEGPVAPGAPGWTAFGNVYTETLLPHNGSFHMKTWGENSGIYQDFDAAEGQTWTGTVWALNPAADAMVGTQLGLINIEWYDASDGLISAESTTVVNSSSPLGSSSADYILGTVSGVAPVGTATARLVLTTVNDGSGGGAVYFDDATFVSDAPPSFNLADFTLTADVLATVNTEAGETLGDLQLRMEDLNGNRLVFYDTATGGWQQLGGSLDTATEAGPDGVPAMGVFDFNAPRYTVVMAFDDEGTNQWGTGGTLTVDNLQLPSTDSTDSDWYAGLFWNDLSPDAIADPDLSRMYVAADVLPDDPNGDYELRVECFTVTPAGVDEMFSQVAGDCGASGDCSLLTWEDTTTIGDYFNFSADWDTGVAGEGAFGGVANGQFFEPGGIFVSGLGSGGTDGTGGAEIRIDGVGWDVGGGWYAGIDWPDQGLATPDDLSLIMLEADIKGTTAGGGSLGNYELRIEDAQGDRLYFPMTANGDWQAVGGPLSTATEGPAHGGGGDGTFDLDSPTYSVVVSFVDEITSWVWGGALEVDNVYLTPVDVYTEIGRVSFPVEGTGARAFETTGGLLSEGVNAFGNLDEDFETVTGTGGGEFYASSGGTFGGQPWDEGIEGEQTFAGTWGSGTLATETAVGCTDCGSGGGGAGVVSVTGAGGGVSGGWWAGFTWPVAAPDWTDLDQVFLTAEIKASKLAPFMLRVEDLSAGNPEKNPWLAFEHTPTTTEFEPVGGAISTAVEGCAVAPCPAFNYSAPSYNVTLVFSGDTGNTAWGSEGSLTIDNLFFTGLTIGATEAYTVTLSFENALDSWSTEGGLTLDNLVLVSAANEDRDGDVDLKDYAAFQNCYTGAGGSVSAPCAYADLDVDGDTDQSDYELFLISYHGPQ